MDLVDCDEAAIRLGVSVRDIEQMICDGTLFAVRFAAGIKVVVDDPPPADD
jgi:hypothetical protein